MQHLNERGNELVSYKLALAIAEQRVLELERGIRDFLQADPLSYGDCVYCGKNEIPFDAEGNALDAFEFATAHEYRLIHADTCPIYELQALVAPHAPVASVSDDYKG